MIYIPHDPRAICNGILDEAGPDADISNLALQKLLYFSHAIFLIENSKPLISGYFEAWQYGPVHPAAYAAFKAAGRKPIAFRAMKADPLTGRLEAIALPEDKVVIRLIKRIVVFYGSMTAGQLVGLSHAKDAPWHFVVEGAKTRTSLGLRIPDDVIASRFKFHKVSSSQLPPIGDDFEDAPFA